MRTATINIYEFHELSGESQKMVIENNRYMNVEDASWWSDSIINNFREELPFSVDETDVYFSGFASQGDGACFDFSINTEDALTLLKKIDPETYKVLENNKGNIDISIFTMKNTFGYHYCHERTREIACNIETYDMTEKEAEEIYTYIETIESVVTSWYRDLCRSLYHELEEEYDYRISDEAVKEALLSNEYEFTGYGEIV